MKLSVLITFYNQEKYVDYTLESVFSQECDWDFEVLVGEDSSSDHTMDKLMEWKKKYPERLQIFVMEREEGKKYNGSQRASRNRLNLLSHVSGEYFIFLDGDDFYNDKRKLQKQIEILDKAENQKYVACAHNMYEFDEEKGINRPFLKKNHVLKLSGKTYWGRYYFHPNSIMFRSKYIKEIPRELVLDYFNDNTITFCFLKYGGIYYLPDIMASYRQTGDGIWTGHSQFINYLRNLMDLDLEKKIAPEFWTYSLIRHRADISYFFKCREKQNPEKIRFYREKIERDGLENSKKWIAYSQGEVKVSPGLFGQYIKATFLYVAYHVKWLVIDEWIRKN